ncbi:MAG: protein-L-isoaspartate(D-aspartate) O-methyltransferase [Actinomycetota bacterium]|nr:protein-L-isoaspartate(D-aspartate) O-methyltransferase [Actinomycetota bacterium]
MPRSQEGLARLIERDGVTDRRVIDAFRSVDRALFVPSGSEFEAYDDRPVRLPEGQTTSQPSLIARMLEAVAPSTSDVALEIGAGYGFQTALLARICQRVVAIERWQSLANAARTNIDRAGITNATVVFGDGYEGEALHAPYDVIVVSAAAKEVPPALSEQLREGGRLVIPLRVAHGEDVMLFAKADGALQRKAVLTPARFVPLVRDVPSGESSRG